MVSTETYVKKRIGKKIVKKEAEKKIPKKFIAHIVELGFDAKDASRLYENKDDWLGISSGGLILCTERGCKFSTQLNSDCLIEPGLGNEYFFSRTEKNSFSKISSLP